MARKARRKSKKSSVNVDFSGVETRRSIPDDDYLVKVEEITKETTDDDNEYLSWKFRTVDDDSKKDNVPLYFNTSLQPQALWNLRSLLETLGIEVPDGAYDLDLTEPVDKLMMAVVENEKYDGKRRPKIVDFFGEDEDGEADENEAEVDEDEDEDDGKKKKGKGAAKKKKGKRKGPDPVDSDDVRDMDADELEELIEEYDLEVELKKHRTLKKKIAAVLEALEEADLLEEDED